MAIVGSQNRSRSGRLWFSRRPHSPAGGNRLLLLVLACTIYFAGRSPFIGQWDSFDYLKQIFTHRLSDLGFGRPVFIGFNVVLWESFKHVFNLRPFRIEALVMAEVLLLGALGVLAFRSLTRQTLPSSASRLAVPALLLAPMYAFYSGSIMTEVPMLVALVTAAALLWPADSHRQTLRDLAAGVMFGLAIGVREQAVTMGAGYLWILWSRREGVHGRLRSMSLFGAAAALVGAGPVAVLYLQDPPAFQHRMQIWLQAIPMGRVHFWRNLQASLLYTVAACPAAWLLALGAGIRYRLKGVTLVPPAVGTEGRHEAKRPAPVTSVLSSPAIGMLCFLLLPVALLWRDADVQIHPRYALIVLPPAILLCAALYVRWAPSPRAATTWILVHLSIFGIAQVGLQPLRYLMKEKRDYAQLVREAVPGEGLLIPGGYSPIMDYYRALGDRPQWEILWSGWGWEGRTAEAAVRAAWSHNTPVYLCRGPAGWIYFEDELLDLYYLFRRSEQREVAPGLFRIYPEYR
jgi:hypothetical protein